MHYGGLRIAETVTILIVSCTSTGPPSIGPESYMSVEPNPPDRLAINEAANSNTGLGTIKLIKPLYPKDIEPLLDHIAALEANLQSLDTVRTPIQQGVNQALSAK